MSLLAATPFIVNAGSGADCSDKSASMACGAGYEAKADLAKMKAEVEAAKMKAKYAKAEKSSCGEGGFCGSASAAKLAEAKPAKKEPSAVAMLAALKAEPAAKGHPTKAQLAMGDASACPAMQDAEAAKMASCDSKPAVATPAVAKLAKAENACCEPKACCESASSAEVAQTEVKAEPRG
ncbi:MAG: hypothetical protein ACPGN3_16180 [Opitutales bacterium]